MRAPRGRGAAFLGGASTRGAAWAFARRRGRLEAARETRPGREASRVHLHAVAAAGADGEGLGRGLNKGFVVLPVNPPSPALRGLRGPRRTRCRAAGALAPLLGLRSRRKMTSLNRPAPRSPHTPDAIGSVSLRCDVWLCRFARGVFEGCFHFGYKTRASVDFSCW